MRRARRLHHGGVLRAAEQEHSRSRGELGEEADEGQGVRARREARGSRRRRGAARHSARGTHRERDRFHARASGRFGSERNAVTGRSVYKTWMPEAPPVVTLESVTVAYGKNRALRDVTSSFASGAVGLLGPNGAGKSTMIKALLGFLVPERGRMRVLGLDVAEAPLDIRARVGYMPESDAHIPGMNAVSFVAYCGELVGLPRVDAMQRAHEVLFYCGLSEARYRNVETYSTGMKQRIKLAQALVHDPDLLFLDEPTNGMDPKGRDEMLELVRDLAHNKGVNLILSSHLLPDVEYTCDDVVVMDKGRIATAGPIDALKQPRGRVYELRVKTPSGEIEPFIELLRARGLECHATDEDVMRVFVPGEGGARDLFALAAAERVQVRHLRPSVPTLEDVFANAVGEQ